MKFLRRLASRLDPVSQGFLQHSRVVQLAQLRIVLTFGEVFLAEQLGVLILILLVPALRLSRGDVIRKIANGKLAVRQRFGVVVTPPSTAASTTTTTTVTATATIVTTSSASTPAPSTSTSTAVSVVVVVVAAALGRALPGAVIVPVVVTSTTPAKVTLGRRATALLPTPTAPSVVAAVVEVASRTAVASLA